jgi:hypothetical protein
VYVPPSTACSFILTMQGQARVRHDTNTADAHVEHSLIGVCDRDRCRTMNEVNGAIVQILDLNT